MSERKVLNKYYPPDFDPSKIPRARQGKNRQFTVRLMAPCNMRCNTCGEYIYKGKKFNARKEDVENETYLGIRIYRFYIKCTRCLQEISFKTDPESTDYVIEAGATRNFMALKLAEEQAEREEAAEKEDEATNPMKVLEKRTQASRHEMAVLEALEELKELNQRQITPSYDNLLEKYAEEKEQEGRTEEEEDEAFIRSVFGKDGTLVTKRIEDEGSSSDEDKPPNKKFHQFSTEFDSSIWKSNTEKGTLKLDGEKPMNSDKTNQLLFQKRTLSKLVKVAAPPKLKTEPKLEPVDISTSSISQARLPLILLKKEEPSNEKKNDIENSSEKANISKSSASETNAPSCTGLGLNLLGAYDSDSDSTSSSNS